MKKTFAILLTLVFLLSGCATIQNMSKTAKGGAIGAGAGAVVGAVVGKLTGNTAVGAAVGAAVGGTAGALVGKKMDKQAEEVQQAIGEDAKIERVGEDVLKVEFNSAVLFEFGKSDLSIPARSNLDKLVTILNTYPDTDIEIQGHTDNVGTEEFNQGLSERRASTVATYVVSKGINSYRITTRGFGELIPKYDNISPEGRAENRRVEFVIKANEKMKADAEAEVNK